MYKEKIYQAMDSFLTESTDLKEKPIIRSVETLNKDRHLFVEKMEEIIQEVEQNSLKNFTERLRGDLILHPDLENLNEIITKRLDKIIKN